MKNRVSRRILRSYVRLRNGFYDKPTEVILLIAVVVAIGIKYAPHFRSDRVPAGTNEFYYRYYDRVEPHKAPSLGED